MTIVHQHEFEPTLESNKPADTLYPIDPATSSENIVNKDNSDTQEVQVKTSAEQLEEAIYSDLKEFDAWLVLKVRNELVSQLYTGIEDESQVNIVDVQKIIIQELKSEKEKNVQQALRLFEVIPRAEVRQGYPKGPDDYGPKDIDAMQLRIDVNHEVINYIGAIMQNGEEGLYSFTESYISRTHLDARNEVLRILVEQKSELRERNTKNEVRISRLESAIVSLKAEVVQAHEQLEDRDMQLLDNEVINHLMDEAKELAR